MSNLWHFHPMVQPLPLSLYISSCGTWRRAQISATLAGKIFESMAFSPDGKTLATASWDGIKLWDVATRRSTAILEETPYGGVKSMAFSPDGTLATGSEDGTITLWDVATGNSATLEGHGHRWDVTSVAFSPDGTLLASGSEDETVKLWDIATGTKHHYLEGHTQAVTSVHSQPMVHSLPGQRMARSSCGT